MKLLDKDGDGKVDRNEFTRHLLLQLGKVTQQDLIDVDRRYSFFLCLCVQLLVLKAFFLEKDLKNSTRITRAT